MTGPIKETSHPPFGEGKERYTEWSCGMDVLILLR